MKWFIAFRHLKKRRGFFLSLSALLTLSGIIIGVMTLNITLAVMNGFDLDLKDKILGINPHIIIVANAPFDYAKVAARVRQYKNSGRPYKDLTISPYIAIEAALKKDNHINAVELKGIEKDSGEAKTLKKKIKEGEFTLGNNKIVIGRELARNLGITVGQSCQLLTGYQAKTFTVEGIFDCGMYIYDSRLVYISLAQAQSLFGYEETQANILGLRINQIYQAKSLALDLQENLGPSYRVRSWEELNRNLFAALKLERTVMFIILGLIILVAGFGIANTLMMMVMQKTRDIGVLKSLGVSRAGIRSIFLREGIILGLSGIILGSLAGLTGARLLARYQFIKLPADVYYLSTLPVEIRSGDFLYIGLATFIVVLVFSLYPAHIAARLNPNQALRYE